MVSVHELNKTIKSIEEMQQIKIRNFAIEYSIKSEKILKKNEKYVSLKNEIDELTEEKKLIEKKHKLSRWDLETELMTKFKEQMLQVKLQILAGNKPDDPELKKLFNWNPQENLE